MTTATLPGLFARTWWRDGRGVRWALVAVLLGCTVAQRFGLSFGSVSLHVAWLAMMALLMLGVASGRLAVVRGRLLLGGLLVAVGGTSLAVNEALGVRGSTSIASWALLATMYLPFLFVLKPDPQGRVDAAWMMRLLADLALACAVVGIVQFAAQFVIDARWLFDFSPYLPPFLRSSDGYNVVIPVGSLYKANGFFFKEPSLYSLVLGFGILLEIAGGRRVLRLAVLGLAMALTYSGSGLLVLAVGLLFPLTLRTLGRLAAVAAVGAVAAFALWDVLNLGFTLGRVGEFTDPRSSAYQRYVAPMRLVVDSLGSQPWTFWIGHGPGSITRVGDTSFYTFHDPTWAKALFEYGVIGFGAVTALALLCLRHAGVPIQLRAAAFFAWFASGGFLLTPEALFLIPLLSGLMPPDPGSDRDRASPSA
jgi:hypothetical protein